MDCDSVLHDDLKENEELICPFCDKQLTTLPNAVNQCCSEWELENIDGMNICVNCGLVHGYDYVTEYVNFYDNMHRIQQKSVYRRKYHIENVLDSISNENNIQLTYHQREQIHKVFVEIDSVLHEVNDGHKRTSLQRYQCNEVEEDINIL